MREFAGRSAVVTGAASGIGRALARRCAAEGMAVALADVDEPGLEAARRELAGEGARAIAVRTDVARAENVEALAAAAESAFGPLHLVFNNAGVLVSGRAWTLPLSDWEWVLGVNLFGVVHGVRSFVPRMLAHGQPAHLVNTASVGGLVGGPFLAPYLVSKHAVVALSECLHHELQALGAALRVAVLCPGAVATGIGDSERVRPAAHVRPHADRSPGEEVFEAGMRAAIAAGTSPTAVADATFAALREDRFWILPDPGYREAVERRTRSIVLGTDPADLGPEARAGRPPAR
jgi:NAD(P)-dependent dehydrogenase (short-subunit alcohol dehydrogenase family)